MKTPKELHKKVNALIDWLDEQNLSPTEALAVCGLFCSMVLTHMDDAAYNHFKLTLDTARNLHKQIPSSHIAKA